MTLAFAMIIIPTACYAVAAVDFYARGDRQMAIVFTGYSIANIGFLWKALKP